MDASVTIAVPSDPERAQAILTAGRRIARSLGLGWIAVRITRGRRTADELQTLVTAMGGTLRCERARDVAAALVDISSREGARVLVIGRSRRPRILRRLLRGTTERILAATPAFDVVITAHGASR